MHAIIFSFSDWCWETVRVLWGKRPSLALFQRFLLISGFKCDFLCSNVYFKAVGKQISVAAGLRQVNPPPRRIFKLSQDQWLQVLLYVYSSDTRVNPLITLGGGANMHIFKMHIWGISVIPPPAPPSSRNWWNKVKVGWAERRNGDWVRASSQLRFLRTYWILAWNSDSLMLR